MKYNLFVDPGELKSDSKFIKCEGMKELAIALPGLEEQTGADIMIGKYGLPKPANTMLLKMHLDQGALLVQLKFNVDLAASIIDGRLKHSQAKMLDTGAHFSQIVLLFVGWIHEEVDRDMLKPVLMIDNKMQVRDIVSPAKNLTLKSIMKQRLLWAKRGGVFEQIETGKDLSQWIESAAEVTFNEPASKQVWKPKQELFLIDGWRNLLVNLPGLGEKKAQDIYDWLDDKSFYGFMAALEDGSLTDVPGIGSGTIEKIKRYLRGET